MGAVYTYQPLAGPLTGASFEAQTSAFLADAASRAEWGNVEGRPDLEGWQTTVNSQLADLDARADAVEQGVATAQSGVSANAGAIDAVRDRTTAAERNIDDLTDRADAGERAAAALAEQVGADEQTLDATRADLSALEGRTTANEASLTAAHNEAAAAAQAARNAKDRAENHAERHAAGGPDALAPADIGAAAATITITAGTGLSGGGDLTANRTLAVTYGTAAATACQGNDARLTDARPPTAHKSTHKTGGNDALAPADIGAAPAARGVPVGLIALWNGTALPTGWAECTGTEGTPDLSAYAGGTLRYIQFKG